MSRMMDELSGTYQIVLLSALDTHGKLRITHGQIKPISKVNSFSQCNTASYSVVEDGPHGSNARNLYQFHRIISRGAKSKIDGD